MKKLSLAIALAFAAVGAQAATVSFNFTNGLQTTEINQTGTLGLFDSSLGMLTGASLSIDGALVTTISLTNRAAQAQQVKATGNVDLDFTSTLGALNAILSAAPVSPLTLSATTGTQTIASGATVAFGPLNDAKTRGPLDLSSILASLSVAGGGNFGLGCTSLSGLALVGGGGNVGAVQATQASCGARITYTYTAGSTPVPEPTSLALVGLALAAAGVAARRKA
jgi:hypothetical protein